MGKAAKHTRRLFRTLIGVVLFAAILLFVTGLVFMIPSVQTKAARKAAAILSEKLQTEIAIDKLRLYWNLDFLAEGVCIEDRHGEPMLAFDRLKSHLPHHNRHNGTWHFDKADVENLLFYIAKYEGEEENNMKFLFNMFSSDKPKKQQSILFRDVRLKKGAFVWFYEARSRQEHPGIWNYSNIRLREINAQIDKISVADGECILDIRQLDCKERSGFSLENLQTLLTVSNRKLYLENTMFDAISGSHIDMDFRFDFKNWKQFSDFEDSVFFRCMLRPSQLHTTDLTYFSPALQGVEPLRTHLQCKVENSLSHLEIKQFMCVLDDSTRIRGNLYTEGLQHAGSAHWNAEINELSAALRKFDGMSVPGGHTIRIPKKLENIVIYQGEADFNGSFSDFTADISANGNIGAMRAYGSYRKTQGKSHYDARVRTHDLQLNQILESPLLGSVTAQGEISGSASNLEEYRLDISSLELNGRELHNVQLQGDMEDNRLGFRLTSSDSELVSDIKGFVEIGQENNIYYASGDISRFNLSAFHFLPEDSAAVLSLQAKADLTGKIQENLSGTISVSHATLTENGRTERIPSFRLITESRGNREKDMQLLSAPLQASLSGRVQFSEIIPCLHKMVRKYLPNSTGNLMQEIPDSTHFRLSVALKRPMPLLETLLPKIRIGSGFEAEAQYSETDGNWRMTANAASIGFANTNLKDCRIVSANSDDTLNLSLRCGQFFWNSGDTLSGMEDIRLHLDCFRDTAVFRLCNQPDGEKHPPYADLQGTMHFEQLNQCILQINHGSICLQEDLFVFSPDNEIILEKDKLQINRLQLTSGNQQVSLEGYFSSRKSASMDFRTQNLQLTELKTLLVPYGISLGGTATGNMHLVSRHPALRLAAAMHVDSLIFNDVAYGHLESTGQWQESEKKILLNAKLLPLQEAIPAVQLQGYYKPETQWIDMHGKIRNFNLHATAPYLSSFATAVEGSASGDLNYSGPIQNAALNGILHLDEAKMRIGYINTEYLVNNQDIIIQDSSFLLNNVKVSDIQGHTASLDGQITHHRLKQWGVRLDIRTENTMVLNTDYRDNDLFFGKAFGTGTVRLRLLPQGDLLITGDMKTEKQTYISILLSKGASVQKHQSYIVFEKPYSISTDSDTAENRPTRSTRTRLLINLNTTPDATLKVVLDPSIGGTIIGNGSGGIRMELQPDRPFEMYGSYTLAEGSVDLALGNVFTRTLKIENGSSLNWNGLPDKGIMNVRASYDTKTSITSLLGESSVTSSYRSVPVSTGLRLKGELLNPDFDFDIRLDNVDESIRSMVYNTLDTTDKENMFRQAFSLLLLGRFDVRNPESDNNVNYSLGYSLSELFSHYLQKMMSTITDNVNVGFLYRPGDGVSSGDEYNMQLSTNLMENRLTIRGNLDIYGENSEQNERQAVAGNVVGDIVFEYKITKDGSLRVKGFNMANYYDVLSAAYSDVPYYQGIGITFTKDFNTLKELFIRKRKQ